MTTATRWRLKACPRCGGDVFVEANGEEVCLQGGHRKDPNNLELPDWRTERIRNRPFEVRR